MASTTEHSEWAAVVHNEQHHPVLFRMRWPCAANLFLGAWLVFHPFAAGARSASLLWSDIVSGVFVALLAGASLWRGSAWSRWATCVVGIWLLIAPLIFWAPSAAEYGNDTLIGILVILFSVLVPHPIVIRGLAQPPGWSYNPSTWHHRTPIIALGFLGFFIARHMAAYQMGHISDIWDPFFGRGTHRVLTSDVSKAFPVSDAGLGAAAYLLESLSGLIGDTRRWRTMPWMVLLFFFLVVPAGVVSIVLIMLQPVAVGAWCTLCLATAATTLITIPPAVDEVVAMAQFLLYARRKKLGFWKTFWQGGDWEDGGKSSAVPGGASGITIPWTLALSAAIGLWLVVAPHFLGFEGWAAHNNQVLGAMVLTFAVIATADAARMVRWLNILFALGLLAFPWLYPQAPLVAKINSVAAAVLIIALAWPKGRLTSHFGSWDRYIV